jgi:hypothetical protein
MGATSREFFESSSVRKNEQQPVERKRINRVMIIKKATPAPAASKFLFVIVIWGLWLLSTVSNYHTLTIGEVTNFGDLPSVDEVHLPNKHRVPYLRSLKASGFPVPI